VAANKCDLFEREQIPEKEARQFSNDIGATFNLTSALSGGGIEDMFKNVGLKVLDPGFEFDNNKTMDKHKREEVKEDKKIVITTENVKKVEKKGKCC
jgi:hypothetical protein